MLRRQLFICMVLPWLGGLAISASMEPPTYGPKPYVPEYIDGIQPTGPIHYSEPYRLPGPIKRRLMKMIHRKPKIEKSVPKQDLGPQTPCAVDDDTCYVI